MKVTTFRHCAIRVRSFTVIEMSASSSSSLSSPSVSSEDDRSFKKRSSKLRYKPEWKQRFMMAPVTVTVGSEVDDEMMCLLCNERMKAKCSTAIRHIERKHPKSKDFSEETIS